MLTITVPGFDYIDEKTNEFGHVKTTTLQLEHSLVSLSKWERKWHIPFLGRDQKTNEQCLDYVRCMTITQNVDPNVYYGITPELFKKINDYIEDPMTATWFGKDKQGTPNREVVTAELIYYWMIALEIPFECQKWHLNSLLTLIRVCNAKNAPSKKQSRSDILAQNRALNAARKRKLNSRG